MLGGAVVAMLFAGFPAIASPSITITQLGTLPGGTYSSASAVNDSGTIAGTANSATSTSTAVTWRPNGTITDLGQLPGGDDSEAVSINDNGVIVGDGVDANGVDQAIRWSGNGTMTTLPTLSGSTDPTPTGINDNGAIVGSVRLASGDVAARPLALTHAAG